MALNPFFLQGSFGEQRLVQELINEQLKIYGVEVTYIPRKFVRKQTILEEIQSSQFDDNFLLEAYINNYDGYSGAGDIMTKFGVSLRDELSLTISKERFEDFIAVFLEDMDDDEIEVATRPREGDLIYFPLGQRIFEVKFVEHENPFYQLGKNYVYELKCELFEYEDEVIDTTIDEISETIDQTGYIVDLIMAGAGTTNATATAGVSTGYVRQIFLNNDGYGYTSAPTVTFSAPDVGSGTTATAVAITTTINKVTSVKEILFTNAGSGYTSIPTITISGGGGTGAAATCGIATNNTVRGVTSLSITNRGAGYAFAPTITIDRPDAGATATGTVGSSGTITSFTVTNGGVGYTGAPSVTIAAPIARTGALDQTDGQSNGTGYQIGDRLTLVGSDIASSAIRAGYAGTEAILEVTSISGAGGVTGFTTIYSGHHYLPSDLSNSNDYYEARGGSGNDNFRIQILSTKVEEGTQATATASIGSGSTVVSLTITNAGLGYTSPGQPVITISNDPSFKDNRIIQATARSTVSAAGTVSQLYIIDAGAGYGEAAPTVSVGAAETVGVGTYWRNEVVTGSVSGTTARVKRWTKSTYTLQLSNIDGTFADGETVTGAKSGASYDVRVSAANTTLDKYNQSEDIEIEADGILDFSESNPFGNY